MAGADRLQGGYAPLNQFVVVPPFFTRISKAFRRFQDQLFLLVFA